MNKSEFRTLNGRTLSVSISAEFLESTRQHAIDEGSPTAYVAPLSHVIGEPIETDEFCIVVAMPELNPDGIEFFAPSVISQVRTRPDGTPIACALLANGQVAVPANVLNDAHPLRAERLTVLWMFRETSMLCHYPYDESTEEQFWTASMVADGHRHETTYGAGLASETEHEDTTIEVLKYFIVQAAA